MEPALVSAGFYFYVIVLCRLSVHLFRNNARDSQWLYAIVEFFGTLQLCACVFENGAFLYFYGWPGFYTILSLMVVVHTNTLEGAIANPASVLEDAIRHKMPWSRALVLLMAECLGGAVSYQFCRQYWRFGLHPMHQDRFATYACQTDLNVHILLGVLLEFGASLIAQIAVLFFCQRFPGRTQTQSICNGCTFAAITCAGQVYYFGLFTTGMYYNPILASALTFGCDGLDSMPHLFVYWVGPTVGQYLGTELYEKYHKAKPIEPQKKKKDD